MEWLSLENYHKTVFFNRQQDVAFGDIYMLINYLGISVEDYIVCFILGPR